MPPQPRVVTLAASGRKLNAPPEQYGPKKQLQIKGWLKGVDQTSGAEDVSEQDVEASDQLDPEIEALYNEVDLKESVDGTLRLPIGAPAGKGSSSPSTPSRPTPPGGVIASKPPDKPQAATSPTPTGRPPNLSPAVKPSNNSPISSSALPLDEDGIFKPFGPPSPASTPNSRPSPGPTAAGQQPAIASSTSSLPPFSFMTREDRQRAIEASAFVILGRAEAGGGTETDQLKRALMISLEDKVKMEEEVKAELAEIRRQKQMVERERDEKLKGARTDVERAEKRAESAEAELSRVRAEAMRVQQEMKSKKMEVEDKEDDYNAEISKLKREAAEMMARLQEQGLGMESTVRKAMDDAEGARQALLSSERQRRKERHEAELSRTRLEMEVSSLKAELTSRATEMSRMERERQALREGWEKEAAARILAEESEKKALETALRQSETKGSLLQAKTAAEALRQHQAALSSRHSSLLRATDPVQALVGGQAPPGPSPTKSSAHNAASNIPPSSPAPAPPRPSSTSAVRPTPSAPAGATRGHSAAVHSNTPTRPPGPNLKQPPPPPSHPTDPDSQLLHKLRLEHHSAMQKQSHYDKAAISDAARAHKRALLAAQLQEAKQAEEALSVAPDFLKCMGLAFRGYCIGQVGAGQGWGTSVISPALTQRYRLLLDPAIALEHSQRLKGLPSDSELLPPHLLNLGPEGSSPPSSSSSSSSTHHLVRLCASVVVLASSSSSGLLSGPFARAALKEASSLGLPLYFVTQPSSTLTLKHLLDPPPSIAGASVASPSPPSSSAREASTLTSGNTSSEPLSGPVMSWLEAAWEGRVRAEGVEGPKASKPPNPTTSTPTSFLPQGSGPEAEALSHKLGLPDSSLRALPSEALKRLSPSLTGHPPDLAHLNSSRLAHLKVSLASEPQPSAGGGGGGGGGGLGLPFDHLLSILRGNSTLTSLTLLPPMQTALSPDPTSSSQSISGSVSEAQARALVEALATSCPSSSLSALTLSTIELPIRALLGSGPSVMTAMDLSQANGLSPEDCFALCTAFKVGKGCTGVTEVGLPSQLSPRFFISPSSSPAPPPPSNSTNPASSNTNSTSLASKGRGSFHPVASELVACLAKLPNLKSVNRVNISLVRNQLLSQYQEWTAKRRAREEEEEREKKAGGGGGGPAREKEGQEANEDEEGSWLPALDLSGRDLGPLALTLILTCLSSPPPPPPPAAPNAPPPPHSNEQADPEAARPPAHSFLPLPSDLLRVIRGLNLTGCLLTLPLPIPPLTSRTDSSTQQQPIGGLPREGGLGLDDLRRACLADNSLGPEGVQGLVKSGWLKPSSITLLRVLDLSLNRLEDLGARHLAQLVLSKASSLQVLALNNNGIGAEGGKAISIACPTMPKLKELHLSGNHLGDAGVAALFGPLGSKSEPPCPARYPCLLRLFLDNNYSISGEGARALGASLNPNGGCCPCLVELRLSKNSVGPEGARQLATGLCAEGCQLKVLDLSACKVRAEGAGHLAQALLLNASLTSLSLDRNAIGDRGVKPIADALVKNRTLCQLGLQHNSIGLSGCRMLNAALREHNFVISELRMGGNDENESTLLALEALAAMQRSANVSAGVSSTRRKAAASVGPDRTLIFPSSHYIDGVGGGGGGERRTVSRDEFSFGGAASSCQRPPPPLLSPVVGGLSRRVTGGSSNGGSAPAASDAGMRRGGEQEEDLDELLAKYRT